MKNMKCVENSYKQVAERTQNKVDVQEAMEPFYASLYDGKTAMYADGQSGLDFNTLRASLIDMAVLSGKGIDFAIQIGQTKENITNVSYYLFGDCQVSIDGEEQIPVDGNRYEYSVNLEESTSIAFTFTMTDGIYEFTQFIGKPVYTLQAFSSDIVLNNIVMPQDSTATLVNTSEYSTDGTSVLMNVKGVITGNALDDYTYTPKVDLNIDMLEGIDNLSEVSELEFDVYNPGDKFSFTVYIHSESNYVQMGTFEITRGKNTVSLNIAGTNFNEMAQADRIVLGFENTTDGETANTYNFYIDNIVKKN